MISIKRQIESAEEKFINKGGFTENLLLKRIKYRQLPMLPKSLKILKSSFSFTLMELLIVITLITVLVIGLLALINPKKQIEKAWDAKRKNDLKTLQKALEDWYNDKNCYPKPEEICYGASTPVLNGFVCYICGQENSSPSFSPYLSSLPCDPQHPNKKYLYHSENNTCPSWYRIYSELSIVDSQGKELGCQISNLYSEGICGPKDSAGGASYQFYSFGVNSPQVSLERGNTYQCQTTCGCGPCSLTDEPGYARCNLNKRIYTDPYCFNRCPICR